MSCGPCADQGFPAPVPARAPRPLAARGVLEPRSLADQAAFRHRRVRAASRPRVNTDWLRNGPLHWRLLARWAMCSGVVVPRAKPCGRVGLSAFHPCHRCGPSRRGTDSSNSSLIRLAGEDHLGRLKHRARLAGTVGNSSRRSPVSRRSVSMRTGALVPVNTGVPPRTQGRAERPPTEGEKGPSCPDAK